MKYSSILNYFDQFSIGFLLPLHILSAKKSRIKVSFLGETGTLSLEVSTVFLTGKMKKSNNSSFFCKDPRLKYNNSAGTLGELPMNWAFLTTIWRPDTVIINGKDSYLHKMTVSLLFHEFLTACFQFDPK